MSESRKCVTKKIKLAMDHKAIAKVQVGSIHLVNLQFPGGIGVSESDLAVALQYMSLAVPQIATYCSAYGVSAPALLTNEITFTAPSTTYSDSDLMTFVNQIVQQQGLGPNDTLIFINPPTGAENSDAPVSQGILGYHNSAPNPYCFINALGTGFTVDDKADIYALALSHEIAEAMVDPAADNSKPEVCDPCAGNCNVDYRNYFDANSNWLGGSPQVQGGYAFFVEGIATPAEVANCPSSADGCVYSPVSAAPPTPPPAPPGCLDLIQRGVTDLENGNTTVGIEEILLGLECYIEGGQSFKEKVKVRLESLLAKL